MRKTDSIRHQYTHPSHIKSDDISSRPYTLFDIIFRVETNEYSVGCSASATMKYMCDANHIYYLYALVGCNAAYMTVI